MKFLSSIFVILPSLLFSACSSAPPQVEASRNMIETVKSSNNQHAVPQSLWADLVERTAGETAVYKDINIVFGEKYLSALGKQCRKVSLLKSGQHVLPQQRVACQSLNSQDWFMSPNVIDNKNELIHLGSVK